MDERPPWGGDDRRNEKRWEFKREVSIGNLLTMAAIAMPLVLWAITLDRRMALVENAMIVQGYTDTRQEQESARARSDIYSELRALNAKIDRILERR